MISAIKTCLLLEADTLIALADDVDGRILPFLDKLSGCTGKRCFIGVGKSLIVASKIASSFSSIGFASIAINPLSVLHGDLGCLSNDDLVVAISNSGETEILLEALNSIKTLGVEIVSITGNENSAVAKLSSCHYLVSTSEAGAFGIVPSSSSTAVMALGDALLCGLIVRDNLTIRDFYRFHPGGTLGKTNKEEHNFKNTNE